MANRFDFKLLDETGTPIEMEQAIIGRNAEFYQFDFGVEVKVDHATGKITGVREFKPLKVIKPVCKGSPIIFQKLCQGKKLKEAILSFYRHDPDKGDEQLYHTITLQDVSLISKRIFAHDTLDENLRKYPVLEEIHMIAERFIEKNENGNIEHTEDYRHKATAA